MRTRAQWALFALACAVTGAAACGPSSAPQQTAGGSATPSATPAQAAPPAQSPETPASTPEAPGQAAPVPASPAGAPVAPGDGATPLAGGTSAGAPPAAAGEPSAPPEPEFREVVVPAGTALSVALDTGVSSASSVVEDRVRGHLAASVRVSGVAALPAGSEMTGVVVESQSAGKVKGRGRVAFQFTRITAHGETMAAPTSAYAAQARATKGKDAKKIGIGAGAGAIVGGILGGGKGAAIGAGVGGGAGTAVVLGTKGEEVQVPAGSRVRVTLREPVTVRVPIVPDKR